MMVNKYIKFEWNTFDSVEIILRFELYYFISIKGAQLKIKGAMVMRLDGKMEVVMRNMYIKFQLDAFDSIKVNHNFNYFISVKGA